MRVYNNDNIVMCSKLLQPDRCAPKKLPTQTENSSLTQGVELDSGLQTRLYLGLDWGFGHEIGFQIG
jgi:hypothetical protein